MPVATSPYMEQILQRIGLSKPESLVYLHLLEKEYQEASAVAKGTEMNRSQVYGVLNALLEMGLVSFVTRNNVRYYRAANPRTLLDFVKDKEAAVKEILPQLLSMNKTAEENVTVEVFQGTAGGIAVLKDILRTGKDYLVWGEDGSFERVLPEYAPQFIRQLREKGMKERILARQGTIIHTTPGSKVRYLPREYQMPTITIIYGDKIANAIFEKPYYIIVIKSRGLVQSYQSFFEVLWKASSIK
jgi:sugar-specific transcriptional regulator TrmB